MLNALGDESSPAYWAQAGVIGWCDLALNILIRHRNNLAAATESCKALQYLAAVTYKNILIRFFGFRSKI